MGRPKALLHCPESDETFVARAVRIFCEAGLPDVIVVGRASDRALQSELERLHPAPRFVANPAPERGQLSSLIAGIDDAETRGAEAVVVLPVDMPQVRAGTIACLLAASTHSTAPIVRVVHRERHGHPVMFRRVVFDHLRAADIDQGAKAVVQAHANRILDVEVEDPGVLRDVDRPADYEQMFGQPAR